MQNRATAAKGVHLLRAALAGLMVIGITTTMYRLGSSPAVAAVTPSAAPSARWEGSKLALGDRRGVKKFLDRKFPAILDEIRTASGTRVEVDVNWDAIALPGLGERYCDDAFWVNIYFKPLVDALKQLGQDETGRVALRKGLRKIVVSHDPQTAPASNYVKGLTFEGGVLSVNWRPYSNAASVADRTDALLKVLEPKL